MATRLSEIAERAHAILESGRRAEILELLALVAGLHAVAKVRLFDVRDQPASARHLTVKAATATYPVSRSFLYERGESLGIVHRTSTGRLIVLERALREYLDGKSA